MFLRLLMGFALVNQFVDFYGTKLRGFMSLFHPCTGENQPPENGGLFFLKMIFTLYLPLPVVTSLIVQ